MQIGTKDCIVETCMNKLENLDFFFSPNFPFLFSFFICLNLIILTTLTLTQTSGKMMSLVETVENTFKRITVEEYEKNLFKIMYYNILSQVMPLVFVNAFIIES